MKQSDVRVGNLVAFNGTVKPITAQDILNIENFKPIPLTPKRAERFGFKLTGDSWKLKGFHHFELTIPVKGGHNFMAIRQTEKGHYVIRPALIYVHDLQNLYWAFRDEELMLV